MVPLPTKGTISAFFRRCDSKFLTSSLFYWAFFHHCIITRCLTGARPNPSPETVLPNPQLGSTGLCAKVVMELVVNIRLYPFNIFRLSFSSQLLGV